MSTSLTPPGRNGAATSATTSSHTPGAIDSQTQNTVSDFLYTGESWASLIQSDPTSGISLELQTIPTPSSLLASYALLGLSQMPLPGGATVYLFTADFLRRFGDSRIVQFTHPKALLHPLWITPDGAFQICIIRHIARPPIQRPRPQLQQATLKPNHLSSIKGRVLSGTPFLMTPKNTSV